ncbi:MAG: hypothetical protein KDC95_18675 [Planctomycetes bacterium]|nr:hypothetical protein [Planctomycetota bacterium]
MDKQKAEEQLAIYVKVVEEIDRGFERSIEEYSKCFVERDAIEDALAAGLDTDDEFLVRLYAADAKLRTLLRPTKHSIHGEQPERRFWWWGVPKRNAEALEEAARQTGWID